MTNTNFEYTIRNAKADEVRAMAEIEAACFPAAEAASLESLTERYGVFAENFFVVEAEGEIIGFINGAVTDGRVIPDEMYSEVNLHNPDGAYQTVFGINTLPEYRNMGIGSAMIKKMLEHAKECGRKGVILTCKKEKLHFYTSLGFVSQGLSASTHGGATWYDMIQEF